MSIFLSDEETIEQNELARFNKDLCQKCTRITAKAAAIHAVQFMEGTCDSGHFPYGMGVKRRICEGCMTEIHKELGI
jgi:hypothetical protein